MILKCTNLYVDFILAYIQFKFDRCLTLLALTLRGVVLSTYPKCFTEHQQKLRLVTQT